jgi:hypothetical protein
MVPPPCRGRAVVAIRLQTIFSYINNPHTALKNVVTYRCCTRAYTIRTKSTREGSLRSLFKSVFYPPKCEHRVKMLGARFFLDLFLEQRVLRFHRGIVHPTAAIIDRAARADLRVINPPDNRLVRGPQSGVLGANSVLLFFMGGGRIRGRGRREPAPPNDGMARGCPCALVCIPWCRRRAVGGP